MLRPSSPYLDAILGTRYPVLDHGFVAVVDYMGNQDSVVDAARVSYGSEPRPDDTPAKRRGLIRYLMRNWHTSPSEMVSLKLHVKMPVSTARQWIRHRTAKVNEISARYVELPEEFYLPNLDDVNVQAPPEQSKQGRGEALPGDIARDVVESMVTVCQNAFGVYQDLIAEDGFGVAKELARNVLPLGTYTEFIWKMDAHNLMHFLRLRCHPHAQLEIRLYADLILGMLDGWMPWVGEAFRDYVLEAHTFSRQEMIGLRSVFHDLARYYPNHLAERITGALGAQGLSQREISTFMETLHVRPDA